MALEYETGATVMLQLGAFQFGITTAAYQELSRSSAWRWQAKERFGQLAALQFTGPGEDTINLPGVIYPEWRGGFTQVAQMRDLAGQGQPLNLVDGQGASLGRWVITQVEEKQGTFAASGVARRVEFTLQLRKFADAEPGAAAAPGAALAAAAPQAAPATKVAEVQALASDAAKDAHTLGGTLSGVADKVQAHVAPFTTVMADAIGGVRRAAEIVGTLQSVANTALTMVGRQPIHIAALNAAQDIASRASGLVSSAESAAALLRRTNEAMGQLPGVTNDASRAMRDAILAADKTVNLSRNTARAAAAIKE